MSRLVKTTAFAAAALAAAAMALPASAQVYNYGTGQPVQDYGYSDNGYQQNSAYYDQCMRETRERQVAGGLIGAAVGALTGRGVASRNARTEGGVVGAVLGAAVGANAAGSTAACQPGRDYGYDNGYGYPSSYGGYGYDDRYERRDYGYDRGGYDGDDYYRDYPQSAPDYDNRAGGYGYRNNDGCELSESRIRLPDGREETRYVRACPDEYGRYRVVD